MPNLLSDTADQQLGGVMTGTTLSNLLADFATLQSFLGAGTTLPISSMDPQSIQYVSVPLSLTELKAMHSAPLKVIPAAGAGTLIEVCSAVVDLIYGSAAFTGGGVVQLSYGTGATPVASSTIAASVFTGLSANQAVVLPGALTVQASSGVLNTAIYLYMATADFTVGTGCSGVLKIAYRVHNGLS